MASRKLRHALQGKKFVRTKTKLKWKFVWVEKLEGEVLVQKLAGAHIF